MYVWQASKQPWEKADQSTFGSGIVIISYISYWITFFAIVCICGRFWQIQSQFNQAIKSNHHLISFKLHLTSSTAITSKNPVYPLYIFDYYKGNCDGVNDFLNNVDFCTCYQSNNVEFIWSSMKSTLCNAMSNLLHLSNKMLPTTPNISLHLYNTR